MSYSTSNRANRSGQDADRASSPNLQLNGSRAEPGQVVRGLGDVDPEKGEILGKIRSPTIPGVLGRTLSRTSAISNPGPPPDGGLDAWTQAIVAHLVIFNTWGYINSYGVFQNYYVQILGHPPSDISWVGSVQIFLLFLVGTFSGRATDAGYFHLTFFVGSVVQLFGMFMTSLCTEYWQLFLAQGICTGLGNGILFCPTVALIPTYFDKKRAVALAVVSCGSATGGMVFPGIIEVLLPHLGFGWTIRVLTFIALGIQVAGLVFLKPRLAPRQSGPLVEWSAFKEPPYAFFALGMFLCLWGLYPAFYYVGEYGSTFLGLSQANSINLLLIMNGVGLVGRIIPAYIADHYTGPMNMLIPAALASSITVYCWIAVDSEADLVVFASIYGIFASSIQGLFPSTSASLTTDLNKMGTRVGMVFSCISFASLTGSPIAGALITKAGGSFLYAQVFAASALLAGVLTLIAARTAKTGLIFNRRM